MAISEYKASALLLQRNTHPITKTAGIFDEEFNTVIRIHALRNRNIELMRAIRKYLSSKNKLSITGPKNLPMIFVPNC